MTKPKIETENLGEEFAERYGTIEYHNLPRGYIKITNNFFQKYMVKVNVPYVGYRWLHRELENPLLSALRYIVHNSQMDHEYEYIEDIQIYNPRHMWYRWSKPLSWHYYGLALDINPWENQPGTDGAMPKVIWKAFKKFGIDWGGHWDYKDPMHFQLKLLK